MATAKMPTLHLGCCHVIHVNTQTLSLDLELSGVRMLTIVLKAHQTIFLVLHTALFPDAISKATTPTVVWDLFFRLKNSLSLFFSF